ncbi:MAG: serine/threonine protein kinase [Desulfobacteraceae bacterium]|nr:MAG: serine/threonine protein kinase [Desulfobacteraceae bacterium]
MTPIAQLNFDQLIGKEVGTSTLLNELARGGMAVIFVAYQRTLKRQIAVKVLPKSLLTTLAAELFQQEAEAAAILSHPNIVTIYEVGEAEDFLFITMQLVKGRSLLDYIKKARKHVLPSKRMLPLKATLKIITDVLDALDYAHHEDIIHRDIKPANVLIETHTKRPIISDFGLATTTRVPERDSSKIAGTPTYMAPEQILNNPVDRRTDVFATGVMLFEMLVSRLPLPSFKTATELLRMRLELKDRLFQKKPSEMNPVLNREMDEIVFKALSHDPENRYATCREFLKAIEVYRDNHMKKLH